MREAGALGGRELAASAITAARLPALAPSDSRLLPEALGELQRIAAAAHLAGANAEPLLERIGRLLPELEASRARLELANASLGQEERVQGLQVEALRHHAYLAQELDHAVERAVAELSEPRAEAVRLEILFTLRQRRQELLMQLAVATQALAAIRLTMSTNRAAIHAMQAAAHGALSAAAAVRRR